MRLGTAESKQNWLPAILEINRVCFPGVLEESQESNQTSVEGGEMTYAGYLLLTAGTAIECANVGGLIFNRRYDGDTAFGVFFIGAGMVLVGMFALAGVFHV